LQKKSRKRGRPSTYTHAAADEICERLAGGEGLIGICRDEHLPAESTVRSWVVTDIHGFSARYARAREIQAERFVDEIIEISDDKTGDTITTEDGREIHNREWTKRSRLRVDTRKWVMSKILPKKYGDITNLNLSGTVTSGIMEAPQPISEEDWAKLAVAQQRDFGDRTK